MITGRIIFALSWSAFAWANFVVGALVFDAINHGWENPVNRSDYWVLSTDGPRSVK